MDRAWTDRVWMDPVWTGRVWTNQTWLSPEAHSCERAQVSGNERYSRGFRRCNRAKLPASTGKARLLRPRFAAVRGCATTASVDLSVLAMLLIAAAWVG